MHVRRHQTKSDTGRTTTPVQVDTGSTRDSGEPFVPPPCTAEAPPSPVLGCVLPVDDLATADCLAAGHAALLAGTGFATIQAAIDAGVAGDVVVVCPGTWTEELTVQAGIVLEAADPTPEVTVIDGGITIQATSTLRGLTATGGGELGAVRVDAPDVVLECMTVQDNAGSGIVASQGGLVVRESLIRRNAAGYGGGGLVGADLVVEDTTFEENTPHDAEKDGVITASLPANFSL